ncbi:arylsulfatase [Penicillium macrosclerotiorum]|uniref:arylsulfatase n=1 Tax=Penicillium macrosclerotiorum TaxID=303699 RepID=UPI002547BFFB|nr:arylsulfatase [Penicillium macrosclerotiorum]KAJ5691975.1 arylsulfatase [Penicillium macrosclerotiorum]
MSQATMKRPNFLIIVADDLGFSDCSCFGSEIQTPNIDSLAAAAGGMRFTSFHVAAACSPTRAMLMTGTDHHLTGLGQLSEMVRNSPAHQGAPGHEGYLTDKVVAIPELLKEGGYHTMMSGKWHLGLKKEYGPHMRGFERSFALLPGCANHYGYEPQYENVLEEPPRFFETAVTALHMQDSEYISQLPDDFYSSDYYASKLVDFLSERSIDERSKPFFAYLPFSAPHWPLQAPKASMDKYRGQYDDGPEALRLRRLERLKELELIAPNVVPHKIVTVDKEPVEWDKMSAEERSKSSRSMEAFAGMVDRMDENIGRVIQYLKETGEYDNTVICFMSDNGAEGASYEATPLIGDNIVEHIEKYYDNSLDNIGRSNSFVWYGSRWAQAATAPSRLYKMFSTEGGCRVPLVVKPVANQNAGGRVVDSFCTVMDLVPTILDYAGLQHPGSMYKGRQIAPVRGTSWKPFLDAMAVPGPSDKPGILAIHGEDRVTGWEIAGSGALRKGRYKITYVPLPHGPQRWELFDMIEDPGETTELSATLPDIFNQLLKLWAIYAEEVGVVGLAGEWKDKHLIQSVQDEFEDTGRWIRFIGKKDVPAELEDKIPVSNAAL